MPYRVHDHLKCFLQRSKRDLDDRRWLVQQARERGIDGFPSAKSLSRYFAKDPDSLQQRVKDALCRLLNISDEQALLEPPEPPPSPTIPSLRTWANLRPTSKDDFFREGLVEEILRCHRDPNVEILQIVGPGGFGKTLTLFKLRERLRSQHWIEPPDAEADGYIQSYFEHSLPDQGRRSRSQLASPVSLFVSLRNHFGSADVRGAAIPLDPKTWFVAQHCLHGGFLLFDGVESLISVTGEERSLNKEALPFLLHLILSAPARPVRSRLVVLVTREPISELDPYIGTSVVSRVVEPLGPAERAALLNTFRLTVGGAQQPLRIAGDPEGENRQKILEELGDRIGGSPIALTLYASRMIASRSAYDPANMEDSFNATGKGLNSDLEAEAERMVHRYDSFFQQSRNPIHADCRLILKLHAVFFMHSVKMELLDIVVGEKPTPPQVRRACRELARLRLLNDDWEKSSHSLIVHPVVREVYRAALLKEEIVRWQDAHAALYKHFKANRQPWIALRHAVEAGLLKQAFQLLPDSTLSTGDWTERRERANALRWFFEDQPGEFRRARRQSEELSDRERFHVLIRFAGEWTAIRGIADEAVGIAYDAAQNVVRAALKKKVRDDLGLKAEFVSIVGQWRYSLVHGNLKASQEHSKKLQSVFDDTKDRADDFTDDQRKYGRDVCKTIEIITRLFTGDFAFFSEQGRPRKYAAEFELPPETRRQAMKEMEVVYDPYITGHLFTAWAAFLAGHPEQFSYELHAGLRSATEFNDPVNTLLAHFVAAVLCQCAGQIDDMKIHVDIVLQMTQPVPEIFLAKGGRFLDAWSRAESRSQQASLVEIGEMERALEGWQAANANLIVPYYLDLIGHSYRANGKIREAEEFFRRAKELALANNELWWITRIGPAQTPVNIKSGSTAFHS